MHTETWSKVNFQGRAPLPRSGCKSVSYGSLLYFFGGYTTKPGNLKEFFSDMHCFDTETNSWSEINFSLATSQVPSKRTDHSLVLFNDYLYLFGGKGGKSGKEDLYNDLYKFNLLTKTWTEIKGEREELKVSVGHSANVYKDSMYIFGGWNGKTCMDDFYQYSFHTNIWYNLKISSGEKPCPRYRHETLVYGNSLYLFGGVNESQLRYYFDFILPILDSMIFINIIF